MVTGQQGLQCNPLVWVDLHASGPQHCNAVARQCSRACNATCILACDPVTYAIYSSYVIVVAEQVLFDCMAPPLRCHARGICTIHCTCAHTSLETMHRCIQTAQQDLHCNSLHSGHGHGHHINATLQQHRAMVPALQSTYLLITCKCHLAYRLQVISPVLMPLAPYGC